MSLQASSELLIVPPALEHKQSFIFLHGRGDVANSFAGGLLDSKIPEYEAWHEAFPHARFIFPQAPQRKCARWGESMNQWFDLWGYEQPSFNEDLKVEGLKDTVPMVHDLIAQEIAVVGARNVVIGGLSQGCAASMVALLTWQGEPVAGYLGYCGHLPFFSRVDAIVAARDDEDAVATGTSHAMQAVSWYREKLGLPVSEEAKAVFLDTPMFIGHGDDDYVVPTRMGQKAADCMKALKAQVDWHLYPGLQHWYSGEMLRDSIRLLKQHMSTEETQT